MLDQIVVRLIELRKQSESLDMEKARLFSAVQEDKSYKEKFGTFENFCKHCGYHRTTVYDLLRCYRNPLIQPAYPELGAMRASTIAKAANRLPETETKRLIEYAKTRGTSAVQREVKRTLAQVQAQDPPQSQEQEGQITLRKILQEQNDLLVRKAELESELAELDNRLSELVALARELSA